MRPHRVRRVGFGFGDDASSSSSSHHVSKQCTQALRSGNILNMLRRRRQGTPASRHQSISHISQWVESMGASSPSWRTVALPDGTRSTISLCFSPDGATFASTHGDHTVKIVDSNTGAVQHVLHGHPRTPWTVKFHPKDSNTIASGCLAGEVYVWDVKKEQVRWRVTQDRPIISLAFHPEGEVLGIASGKVFYMWRYTMDQHADTAITVETSLRAVMFPSNGRTVIVGIANPPNEVPVELAGQEEEPSMKQTMQIVEFPVTNLMMPGVPLGTRTQRWRSAVNEQTLVDESSGKIIVKHAVLYNDGGMDISSNGNRFVCCMYQTPPPSPALRTASTTDKQLLAQSPRSSTDLTGASGGSNSPLLQRPPYVPRWGLPPPAVNAHTTISTVSSVLSGSTMSNSTTTSSGTKSTPPPSHQTSSLHRPVPRNRVRAISSNTSAYDPTTGRRVRARRRPPPAPLFQLATVGLEDHNYGKILAYQTVEWKTAKGTTSVKFSPSSKYLLVGYGVRTGSARSGQLAVVVSMYRTYVNKIIQVQRVKSTCDDLNIALFHPQVGGGFVFGTKRGNVRRIGIDRHCTGVEGEVVQHVDEASGTYSFHLGESPIEDHAR